MRLRTARGLTLSLGLLLPGCSDVLVHTHAFVASQPCGQGPFDVRWRGDPKSGGDGVEVVACTPRRLAGHVEFYVGSYPLANEAFGEGADNARCISSASTVTTSGSGASSDTTTGGGHGGAVTKATAPALVEQPYTGSETPFADNLCRNLDQELGAQTILQETMMMRTSAAEPELHVRIWSDTPNDLERVVFMIREVTSKKTPAEVAKEQDEELRHAKPFDGAPAPASSPAQPDHGAPPPPLAEQKSSPPTAGATWVPGYWTWAGKDWGWIAGFWRDESAAVPAPRIEHPGAPPAPGSVWIGGSWQLRAGSYVWVQGRWGR